MTDDIRELALRLFSKAAKTVNPDDDRLDLFGQLDVATELVRLAIAEGKRMGREEMSRAASDVLAERARQVSVEGWATEHDDQHENSELAWAAACYALHASGINAKRYWPWHPRWIKSSSPRRDLVKAAALLLAEIERFDRATTQTTGEG